MEIASIAAAAVVIVNASPAFSGRIDTFPSSPTIKSSNVIVAVVPSMSFAPTLRAFTMFPSEASIASVTVVLPPVAVIRIASDMLSAIFSALSIKIPVYDPAAAFAVAAAVIVNPNMSPSASLAVKRIS